MSDKQNSLSDPQAGQGRLVAAQQARARAWQARRAELAAARAAAEDYARRNRVAVDRERLDGYAQGSFWVHIGITMFLALIIVVIAERYMIIQQVSTCFEGAKHPGNYNCANRIAGSFWAWLIPSDLAEQLHAAQLTR